MLDRAYLIDLMFDLSIIRCAMQYRLEKRVMVPLPCAEAREQMVRKNLADRASANLNYEEVQSKCSVHHLERKISR